jgi:hypothetical protein
MSLVVRGMEFSAVVTEELVDAMRFCQSSDYQDKYLVAAAITHTFLKDIHCKAGDLYAVHDLDGMEIDEVSVPDKLNYIEGPTVRLDVERLNVLLVKQPSGEYLHFVHDHHNVCIINDSARCVYLNKYNL